jgi:HEAT repeat protein
MRIILRLTMAVGGLLVAGALMGQPWAMTEGGMRDVTATLGDLLQKATRIGVYQLESMSADGLTLSFKKIADLKGRASPARLKHQFAETTRQDKRCLKRLHTGALAVCFSGQQQWVCLGEFWYWCGKEEAARLEPEYSQIYCGSAESLRQHVAAILQGKEVVITAAAPSDFSFDPSFAQAKPDLPGSKGRIWRIKASLKIRSAESIHDESPYFVGWGIGGPEAVPALLRGLKDKEAAVRAAAAHDLGQLVPLPADASGPLKDALRDNDPLVRICAAQALAAIDGQDTSAVPCLVRALQEKEDEHRIAAVWVLSSLGNKAAEAVPELLRVMQDQGTHWGVRAAAVYALGEIGPEVSAADSPGRRIVAALNDAILKDCSKPSEDGGSFSYLAVATLRRFGTDARAALPAIKAYLAGARELAAEPALILLLRLGPSGLKVIDEGLRDGSIDYGGMIEAASETGAGARALIPTFIGLLKDDSLHTRLEAAKALARLDRRLAARLIVPILIESLKNRPQLASEGPRENLIFPSIAALGAEARAVVPSLIAYLKDETMSQRTWAAEILGRMGTAAKDALPALRGVCAKPAASVFDPEESLTAAAALALWRIDHDQDAIQVLSKIIKSQPDADQDVFLLPVADYYPFELFRHERAEKLSAFEAMVEIGPAARDTLIQLMNGRELRTGKTVRRALTAAALANLERRSRLPHAESTAEAISLLIKVLKKEDIRSRCFAASALSEFGAEAKPAVPDLVNALENQNLQLRVLALRALGAMAAAVGDAAPAVVKLMSLTPEEQLDAVEKRVWRHQLSQLAAGTLFRIQPRHPRLMPTVVYYLEKHPDLDSWWFETLAAMGPLARPAIPVLSRLVTRGDFASFNGALKALRKIDPEAAARAWPSAALGVEKVFPPDRLSAAELEQAWKDLASVRGVEGHRAVWQLALTPQSAAAFLNERLQAEKPAPIGQIKRWIVDLDSKEFGVRATAMEKLEAAHDAAQPALEEALTQNPSLEVARRIKILIEKNNPVNSPDRRRLLRAVEALEASATPEARQVLKKLAAGSSSSRVTRAARAALERTLR